MITHSELTFDAPSPKGFIFCEYRPFPDGKSDEVATTADMVISPDEAETLQFVTVQTGTSTLTDDVDVRLIVSFWDNHSEIPLIKLMRAWFGDGMDDIDVEIAHLEKLKADIDSIIQDLRKR